MLRRLETVVEKLRRNASRRAVVLVLPDIVRQGVEALLSGVRLESLWSDGTVRRGRVGIEI
jgi:hypothetical protein